MNRLRPKYEVHRINEGGNSTVLPLSMLSTDPNNVDSPFVLMPRKDPAAFSAMLTYINYCEPQLANEIRAWLRRITEAKPVFGTQGQRNFTYVRSRSLLEVE